MKALDEIYKPSFFSKRHKFEWRAVTVADALLATFPNVASYVDVGCATGDIVREMVKRNYDAWGIEGSRSCLEYKVTDRIIIQDLRLPFTMRRFSLCTCFEVLEHIEPEYADILVDNLSHLSDDLVISAAPPGQGGHYHVNCQPFGYWEKKFKSYGFVYHPILTNIFKDRLKAWSSKPGIKAFYQNSFILRRDR